MPKVKMQPSKDDGNAKKSDDKRTSAYTHRLPLRVPAESIFINYKVSRAYRELLATGNYIYVDGLFVLRPIGIFLLENEIDIHQFFKSKKIFGDTNGLTDYCLSVEFQYSGHAYKPKPGELMHSAGRYKGRKIVEAAKAADIDTINKEEFLNIISGGSEPPNDFGAMLSYFMEKKEITEEGLAELTGLSDRTIRLMKWNADSRPELANIVAVCIALHLYPHESIKLINAAGYFFRNNKKDNTYQFLIDSAYNKNVHECNRFLESMNLDPLTSL